jgi:hypothetical protein
MVQQQPVTRRRSIAVRRRSERGELSLSSPVVLIVVLVLLVVAGIWTYVRARSAAGPAEGQKVEVDINRVRQQLRTEGFGRRR